MTSFQIASPLRTLRAPAPVTPEAHVLRAGFAGEQANITPGRLEPEHLKGTENARQSSDDMSVGSTLPVDSQVWGQTITFLATATPPRSPEDANREVSVCSSFCPPDFPYFVMLKRKGGRRDRAGSRPAISYTTFIYATAPPAPPSPTLLTIHVHTHTHNSCNLQFAHILSNGKGIGHWRSIQNRKST